MAQNNWQQVKEILIDAMRHTPEERPAFLDRVCSGDKLLRREVEFLLSSYDNAESFLETPAVVEIANVLETETKQLKNGESFGHYEIIRQVGAGGMGEVYLARDTILKRQVALKLLSSDFTNNQERLRRFELEARAASALNHPNILTIHEVGVENDVHFIATEFIDGATLRQQMQNERLTLEEILDIATQTAAALSAAHSAGIVHRDIKPENIMLRNDGFVKVLDFGLAKTVAAQGEQSVVTGEETIKLEIITNPQVVMGTVNYMSPEQARRKAIDARTDIFSFGVMLYEMVAGRLPFAGETTADVLSGLLNKEPAPLTHFAPDAPAELQHIIGKALRKDRDERYQTMKSMLADLKTLK